MISQNTITQVFETARVEEVIGDFVQLKKSGSNYKGLSPFSEERTPSFMVSPVKQIWKDFSSGKGGNAVTFIMEHEHFTYPEAIRYLAKKYNIEIEETERTDEEKAQANQRESLYLVSEYANTYFQDILHHTDSGKSIGLSYFTERGFTTETIKKFQLGYALDEWQAFTDDALGKAYKLEYLEKTGLTIVKRQNDDANGDVLKTFDRFKGRVMFPIHSMSGRILGFGGRILTNAKKAAKYLNSPESDIYHKSKVLYGLYFAKQTIAKEDNCYLVEGYTDVIQLHQKGIENVVSSSGTALTPNQIRLINRLTKNITVLFDGDAAGLRASLRGIDLILEQGMNVKVCTFPNGEDPDSFAKSNSLDEVKNYLTDNAKDFIQFKASILVAEANNDPIKKAETIRDIVNSIAKIPDVIKQEIYVQECARIMDISETVLFNTLAQITKKELIEAQKKQPQKAFDVVKTESHTAPKIDIQYNLEQKIIKILMLYGGETQRFEDLILKEDESSGDLILEPVVQEVKVFEKIYLALQEDEMEFSNPQFKSLYYSLIEQLSQLENNTFSIQQFSNQLSQDDVSLVTEILMEEEKYSLHDWERNDIIPKTKAQTVPQLVTQTILSLRCFLIDKKVAEYKAQLQTDAEHVSNVLEDVKDYLGLKMLLSRKLGKVVG